VVNAMSRNPFRFDKPTRPEHYVERNPTVEQLVSDLCDWDGDSFGLVGGRRFGKSSLLRALESCLAKRLELAGDESIHVLPVSISLESLHLLEPASIFGFMVHRLRVLTSGTKKAGRVVESPLVELGLPEYAQKISPPATLQELEHTVEEIVIAAKSILGTLRVVFLIDEIDGIIDFPWTDQFFGNLRSLIYDGEMKDFVRLILSGSGRYMDLDAQGSPLANAITGCFLEPLTETAARDLIGRASGIDERVADEILKQTGGHPFIIQHILHYLHKDGSTTTTVASVQAEDRRFCYDRSADLENWWRGIGKDGQHVYCILRRFREWMTLADVIHLANNHDIQVDRGLKALCNHGIAVHDEFYQKYRINGQLFLDWSRTRCQTLRSSFTGSAAQARSNSLSFQEAAVKRSALSRTGIDPNQYQLALVTALPKEFAAVEVMLDQRQDIEIPGDPVLYTVGIIGPHAVVATVLPKMGNNLAVAVSSNLLRSFPNIREIIMVGIAGGVPNTKSVEDHVRLGDIVISMDAGVIQFDLGKLEQITRKGKATGKHFTIRASDPPPSARLQQAVRRLEARRVRQERPWQQYIALGTVLEDAARPPESTDIVYDSREPAIIVPHPEDQKRLPGQPKIHYGSIGSSNTLLREPVSRDLLRDEYRIKAIEMEGSGIATASWMKGTVEYLLVRGICDYCDTHKNKVWQGYAAAVAAAYVRALIEAIPVPLNSAGPKES